MKTRGSIAAICALSLALVACGGGAASSTSGEATSVASADSAASTTSATSADSTTSAADVTKATTIVGDWKMAAADMNGILVTGDLAQFGTLMGDEESAAMMQMALSFKEDGTGTIAAGSQELNATWKESGSSYVVTIETVNGDKQDTTATLADGTLRLEVADMGTLIFTADGSYPGAVSYDVASAKPITSESEIIGTWKLVGVQMAGVTMSGDSEAMTEMFGYDAGEVVFEAGGKASLFGDEVPYIIDANGARVGDETLDLEVPFTLGGGNLFIDMSSVLDVEAFMVLAK